MTDLSAGEHIVDGSEIDLKKHIKGLMDNLDRQLLDDFRLPTMLIEPLKLGQPRTEERFPGEIWFRDHPIPYHVTEGRYTLEDWHLNNVPIRQVSEADIRRTLGLLEPCVEQLETNVIARHPSSERFHSLLPNVAEMAYRFSYELGLDTAGAWGVPEWVIAMRNAEYRLRCLQAVARGERTGKSPSTLMMEVAALAMVAKKYHTGDDSPTWAHDYVAGMGELHDRKMADYGAEDDPFANVRASEEWEVAAWVGSMVRLNDKVRRLQSFARRGELANESAVDSIEDISVYAIISRVLYEHD